MPLGPEGNRPSDLRRGRRRATGARRVGRVFCPRSEEDDMAGPDLRFIGERLDRIHTELRELRALKTDVALLAERTVSLESKPDHVASKVETLDAKVGRSTRKSKRWIDRSVRG